MTAQIHDVTADGVILDLDGQHLKWPLDDGAPALQRGQRVTLRLLTAEAEETERAERARAILSEILGGQS